MNKKYYFDNLDRYENKIAIITEQGQNISYKELSKYMKKLDNIIFERDIVFLISDNNFEFIFSYLSLLKKRAVIFLINNNLSKDKLNNLIKIYSPNFILDTENKTDLNFRSFFELGKISNLKIFKRKKMIKIKTNINLAQLLSTSGSTGSPKFVMHSYQNLSTNVQDIVKFLKITHKDVAITTMHPSYTYGLSIINTHISVGATIILNNKTLFESKFWKALRDHNVTNFGGVPFAFEIMKKLKFDRFDLPSLKYITQAGGKLSEEIIRYFIDLLKKKNKKFFTMYGQTEATSRITILDWKYSEKKINSIGKPIGNYKLWIKENNNSKNIGELICKGNNVMMGYAINYNDLNNKISLKTLNTGDLAYKDKDGFYFIEGRIKRIIKIYGLRVNLDEIQQYLKENKFNCTCIGSDKYLNIYTENKYNTKIISKLVSKEFGIKEKLIIFYPISEIPRDINGKIIYKISKL